MAGLGLPHEAVREQLAGALDLVVHQARMPDGMRRVVAVSEVVPVCAPRWYFARSARLVAEAETTATEYRQAVTLEVQRVRTVIDFAGRHVYAQTFELGDWTIPQGYSVVVAIDQLHGRAEDFPDPDLFDPQREANVAARLRESIPAGVDAARSRVSRASARTRWPRPR